MQMTLSPDERQLRHGAANLQRGIETVGGRLTLTDSRLIFSAHSLNVQTGTTEIPLATIRSVQPCWTRFLGLVPLMPNSLAVRTDQAEYRFVLFNRSRWAQAIQAAVFRQGA